MDLCSLVLCNESLCWKSWTRQKITFQTLGLLFLYKVSKFSSGQKWNGTPSVCVHPSKQMGYNYLKISTWSRSVSHHLQRLILFQDLLRSAVLNITCSKWKHNVSIKMPFRFTRECYRDKISLERSNKRTAYNERLFLCFLFLFIIWNALTGMVWEEMSHKVENKESVPYKCVSFVFGHSDLRKLNSIVINRVWLSTEVRFDTVVWVPVWEALNSIIGHLILACTPEVTAKQGFFSFKAVVLGQERQGCRVEAAWGSSVLVWSTTPLWTT